MDWLYTFIVRRFPEKILIQRIEIGSTALVRFASGETAEFTIVHSRDTDPGRGVISYESPLGKALMGKARGEIAEYTVNDRAFRAEVVEIKEPPYKSV